MNEDRKAILEYCGFAFMEDVDWWIAPDGIEYEDTDFPDELTTDLLFKYFVPAWNKKNPSKEISVVEHYIFRTENRECVLRDSAFEALSSDFGKSESVAFASACYNLIKEKA